MIRRAVSFIVPLVSFQQPLLACSLAAGAEDTTGDRVAVANVIFILGLLAGGAHVAVFIYRKGRNGWVFWITFALSLFIIPISVFAMMISAGMSCGHGSIEAAAFTLIFQLAGLVAQMYSWKFSDVSYNLGITND